MRHLMSLLVVVATAANVSLVSAQTNRPALPRRLLMHGIAKSVSEASLTLDVDRTEITFVVDKTTRVISRTHKDDLVLRTPDPKQRLACYVKAGDTVGVIYHQTDGVLTLVEVRVLQK